MPEREGGPNDKLEDGEKPEPQGGDPRREEGDFEGGDFKGGDFKGGDFDGGDGDFKGGDSKGGDFKGRGDFDGGDFDKGDSSPGTDGIGGDEFPSPPDRNRRVLQTGQPSPAPEAPKPSEIQDIKIYKQIPHQTDLTNASTEVKVLTKATTVTTKSLVITLLIGLTTLGLANHVWGAINSLQIMAYLCLNNVPLPYLSFNLFDQLIKVVTFDVFPFTDYITFGFTKTAPFNDKFKWLGYSSSNPIENLGSVVIITALMLVQQLFIVIVIIF